jgi:hypothetical protein
MKHALLITAYKDFPVLEALVNSFKHHDVYIFIHIDKKSKFISLEEIKSLKSQPNIILLKERLTINWGSFNHLLALISLLKKAAEIQDITYFHALSGQDILIKDLNYFFDFFNKYAGKSFISSFPLPTKKWTGGGINRLSHYQLYDTLNAKGFLFKKVNHRFINLQKLFGISREPIKGVEKLYGGGTWWSLNREAVDYSLQFIKLNKQFLKRFKYSFCPEEIFFQTILLNSPLHGNIINDDLRYIDWVRRNGNCPAILDETDLELLRSSPKLFARKFQTPISSNLLMLLNK